MLDPSYIAPRTTDPNTETESDPSGTAASTVYRPEGQGPRVMVLGPESAGKTSLIKFLANYALRSPAVASLGKGEAGKVAESLRTGGDGIIYPNMDANLSEEAKKEKREEEKRSDITGWWPVVVNLDPSDGAPPLPCCLSALRSPLSRSHRSPLPLPPSPSAPTQAPRAPSHPAHPPHMASPRSRSGSAKKASATTSVTSAASSTGSLRASSVV